MKNFLAQEHEKLSLWWAAISAKEITLYLLLTLALLLPVYLYYAALWHHGTHGVVPAAFATLPNAACSSS